MATVTPDTEAVENFRELLDRLGDVPLERILTKPPPGTATEDDVLAAQAAPRKRLCELVDGVLVEKAMGTKEALLASLLAHLLWDFVEGRDLGMVLGADGMLRLFPGRVRIPDVAFISRENAARRRRSRSSIADLFPDLAVEVLSPTNTRKEMERKLHDYFQSGGRLVWIINPKTRTADVYTSEVDKRRVARSGSLDGAPVLPGFRLPLKTLFGRADRLLPD